MSVPNSEQPPVDIKVQPVHKDKLKPKPDVEVIAKPGAFGRFFTDHMLRIEFDETAGGWQQPCIVPFGNLTLHPGAKVFHYAVEAFEGLKAYKGVDGRMRLFRPELNMERLRRSAERMALPQYDCRQLLRCISRLIQLDQEWAPRSDAISLYVRPTLIGSEPTLGVHEPKTALLYTILSPVGTYIESGHGKGISLLADPKYVRAWPGGCGDRKLGANYGPTLQIQKLAEAQGLNQVLWLYGPDHEVTEAGTMNIFIIHLNNKSERVLVTPPLDGMILPGITRQAVLDLSREWGELQVVERKFTMKELIQWYKDRKLLEVFGVGTAVVVSPVGLIQYQNTTLHIPTLEQADPYCLKCLQTILDIQYGRILHPWGRLIDDCL